jgi:two-component system phosphate regulon sensor histidine kinase PhoR
LLEPSTAVAILFAVVLGALWWRAHRARQQAQRQLEGERRESTALRRILEHLNEGVVLLGERKHVLFANQAAATLLNAKHILEPTEIPFAAYTQHQVLLGLVSRTAMGETVRQSLEFEKGDDQSRSVEVTIAPLSHGRRLVVLQDLRVGALVDKRRRDFVANASHELKTPIAAIIGMLDLLDAVDEGKREELLDRARKNALSLANLTDDLLRLARADDPGWKPTPELLHLEELLAEVVDSLQDRAEQKHLTLTLTTDPACRELIADHFSLRTVVQNLVLNAVNYTKEGKIQVQSSAGAPGIVCISVRDTGPGIDPDALPHIFERFFRGDVAHSRASGGTGLGLAIVRNLLRRMGGRISVRSEPGVGSEFLVELPANPTRRLPTT